MALQTCFLEQDLQIDPTMLSYNSLRSFNPAVDTTSQRRPSTTPQNALNYDFFPFGQHTNNLLSPPVSAPLSMDSVDPTLVLPPSSTASNDLSSTQPSSPRSLLTPNSTTSASSTTASTSSPSSSNPKPAPKRRNRRKKAPLSPSAQAVKRADFLEKNKAAARKCRDRNKRKWDRIHEQSSELEAKNKALREMCASLSMEAENLRMLVRTHRGCAVEDSVMRDVIDRLEGRGIAASAVLEKATVAAAGEEPMEEELVDPFTYLDDVPSLSPSRKSSASTFSPDSEPQSAVSLEMPSLDDFRLDSIPTGAKAEEIKQEPFVFDSDENMFSFCQFPGQESLPGEGLQLWG